MFEKIMDDAVLVDAYLRHGSQIPAAEELGCSRETVARAVRRAGIRLTGRKNNGGSGGSPEKITELQLREEVKKRSITEIAQKYCMSPDTVYKRVQRLGLKCNHFGYSASWRSRCRAYGVKEYDDTITLPDLMKRDKGICQICGLPVDTNDREGRKIHKNYPTLDHIVPISKGGPHTWDNVRLAHMGCNAGKCDRMEVRA